MTREPAHAGFARYRNAAWRDTDRHRTARRFSCCGAIIRCCGAARQATGIDALCQGLSPPYRTRD
ncbi:hypothetical protein WJ42_08840 [Burkholderia cepacia]|nr:hypothetical protein WJ42_08840 [Burkholderia cepacia]KWC72242.1 hypothetical protein WL55_06290 [Burkholderia cepacia]